MPSSLHESRSMPSSPSTGSVRSRGSLALLAVLVLGLAVTLVVMRLSPTSSTPRSPASMPAGKVTAAPAELVPVGSPPPKQSRRPNIITILADDMRTDDLRWMPDVRRLIADRGLTFRNSFSPYPLCCPARASLMSGQYAHNHHVFSHARPYGFQAFDDSYTMATALRDGGYNTGLIGKYLNGYGEKELWNDTPRSAISWRTVGMNRRSSARMSSAITRTTFGVPFPSRTAVAAGDA